MQHYLTLFNSTRTTIMKEKQLKQLCFQGLKDNNKKWGFGDKRIGIKIKESITEKIPFSGFGFKNPDGTFKIGVRMWLDQGDYVKYLPYDKNHSINEHFIELIKAFQYEYPHLC